MNENIMWKEILNEILYDDVTIYENISQDNIWINFNNNGYIIKQNTIKNNPVNTDDIIMKKYYENLINYLNNLDKNTIKNINSNYWFNFEYISNHSNIKLSRKPINNLILYSIYKGNKFADILEVIEYSKLLNVDHIPVIYYGKLPDYLKTDIKLFLNTGSNDVEFVFGCNKLSTYIYKMLKNISFKSFMYEFDDIDYITNFITIKTKNNYLKLSQLDELYLNYKYKNENINADYKYLLFDFITYCQNYDLNKIKLKGYNKKDIKTNMICTLFNSYVNEVGYDIINSDISTSPYINNKLCVINNNFIKNGITKNNLNNKKYSYIFYIIYNSIVENKKIFNDNIDDEYYNKLLNIFIESIEKRIDKYMKVADEMRLIKYGLINSNNTLKIKYDTDGSGKVYPVVKKDNYNISRNNKNKKMGKKGIKKYKK